MPLLPLQVSDLLLRVQRDIANGGPPAVEIALLLGDALLPVLVQVGILYLSLPLPVFFEVLLPEIFHLGSVLLLLLNPCSVLFTAHDGLVTEGRGTAEGLRRGSPEE